LNERVATIDNIKTFLFSKADFLKCVDVFESSVNQQAIHTIYAFANDYSNVNGGYWKFSLKITVDSCISWTYIRKSISVIIA